eukprot:TRINITY_DN23694_c0_g1_i1.p1 TRINITY_DN23694_c0_g1~~TRINITY_DN23694_c0_g1_i1.p1  ORF type:complete len:253 (-),score=47.33 TRINITY_DN23694_c0_g1_i1:391-1149(-)
MASLLSVTLVLIAFTAISGIPASCASRIPSGYYSSVNDAASDSMSTVDGVISKGSWDRMANAWRGVGVTHNLCIPYTTSYLEEYEGRHYCAYNSTGGYRAVGVGFNLDENVERAKLELAALALSYDKVYSGESCLWDVQVNALLIVTAKAALDLAAERAPSLDDWCCDVQKVYADVALTTWGRAKAWDDDLKEFVEKTSVQEWETAAKALEDTEWCEDHGKRCEAHVKMVEKGCGESNIVPTKEKKSVFSIV